LLAAAAEGLEVVASFRSAEVAGSIVMDDVLIASGKYAVAESRAELLSLTRKLPGDGPPRIEVVAVATEEEEWRRLIAGEFDLAPSVLPGSIHYLQQIPELRVVPLEFPQTAGVWFRVNQGPTAQLGVRQAIAAAIRRRPLAMSVFGNMDAARSVSEDLESARALLAAAGYSQDAPLRLRLYVHEGQSDLVRAALVLQQQLAAVDVMLDVSVLSVRQLAERIEKKDFDLLLFYGDTTDRFWSLLHGAPEGNFVGYASVEFDAAADAKDQVRAKAILEHDVPLTPLIGLGDMVVIRRRFCNVHPKYSFDYTWLADVRLCAPGEDD